MAGELAVSDFDYLRRLVQERAAILLDPAKVYLAETRLAPIVLEGGFGSVQQLLRRLQTQTFTPLHGRVVDAMTNNETWFFRDLTPFEVLRTRVIPELLQKRSNERSITIWSAASSSGQEPYSVAMLIKENFSLPGWHFTVRATDYSEAILKKAVAGKYSQLDVNRGLPATLLSKYFERCGREWQLKPVIRNMVTFSQLNLAASWPIMPPADIIFLRNVLIYFDIDVRRQIFGKVRRVLRPDGYLVLGNVETTHNIDDCFVRAPFEKVSFYKFR